MNGYRFGLTPARLRATRSEKDEMRFADKAARMMGWRVVSFSQARASKQTPGIPDRLYLHPERGVAFWYESKREKGRVSPQQREMHAHLTACGHEVVVGTAEVAIERMGRAFQVPHQTEGA